MLNKSPQSVLFYQYYQIIFVCIYMDNLLLFICHGLDTFLTILSSFTVTYTCYKIHIIQNIILSRICLKLICIWNFFFIIWDRTFLWKENTSHLKSQFFLSRNIVMYSMQYKYAYIFCICFVCAYMHLHECVIL